MKRAMLQAMARTIARPCAFVLALGLGGGALGYVGAPYLASHRREVALAPESADLQQIEAVLVHRAPELGLGLRRRVATAIAEEARTAGYDPLFVLGLIQIESDFAWDAVSFAGARGLMQLRPATLEYLAGVDGLRLTADEIYRDPALQVRLGIRYLARLEKRFRSLDYALMAYNAGPEKLKGAIERGETDRFLGYVQAVKRNYARFRKNLRLADEPALAQAEAPAAAARP